MSWIIQIFWNVPAPMPRPMARVFVVIAVLVAFLAAWGVVLFDGLQRVLFIVAFSSMAISTLLWAIGSLRGDARRGERVRAASRPFGLVMLIAPPLVAWLEFFA